MTKEDVKKQLIEDYNNKGLVLCIGAGVTAQYVGTWTELLNKLFQERYIDRYLSKGNKLDNYSYKYFKSLKIKSPNDLSPTELAEYLLLDENDASSDLTSELFRIEWREYYLASQIQRHLPEIDEHVIKIANEYNPQENTLDAVLTLCLSNRDKHNAIHHLITYNYDTLIENCLADKSYKQKASPSAAPKIIVYSKKEDFESPPAINTDDVLNIYHVHGTLVRNSSPAPVIFSELSYDLLSDQQYAWANQIQAELYMRYPLLFIGFSGHDPNFRRLIKALQRGGSIHDSYIFMNEAEIIDKMLPPAKCKKKKTLWQHALDVIKESIEYYYVTVYKLHIIWYSHYPEISKMLMDLANANSIALKQVSETLSEPHNA